MEYILKIKFISSEFSLCLIKNIRNAIYNNFNKMIENTVHINLISVKIYSILSLSSPVNLPLLAVSSFYCKVKRLLSLSKDFYQRICHSRALFRWNLEHSVTEFCINISKSRSLRVAAFRKEIFQCLLCLQKTILN